METHDPIRMATDEQIEKAVGNYRAMLVKHSPYFQSGTTQAALGSAELARKQFELFRAYVEAQSSIITRTVTVNRARSPKEAMLATGRTPYLNDHVVANMPRGVADTITMSFYRPGRRIAAKNLVEELDKDGFELVVDPMGQAAVNEVDPAFADTHPNGTQWTDVNGDVCCSVFARWHDEPEVVVYQYDGDWDDYWWFPVRRK
jgi:hypothetical protein